MSEAGIISLRSTTCQHCGKAFIPTQKHGSPWKYCSRRCGQLVRYARAKKKRALGVISGVINGRTIQEERFREYQKRATGRQIAITLTFDQFLTFWQKPCTYCGDSIQTVGLDRLNSALGYVLGNIVPCCSRCNLMKHTRSPYEFIAHCERIAKRAQEKLYPDFANLRGEKGENR